MNTQVLREMFDEFVGDPSAQNLTHILTGIGEYHEVNNCGNGADFIPWHLCEGDFDTVRVFIGNALSDSQIDLVTGAIGYAFREELRGEQLSVANVVQNTLTLSILDFFYDTTKSSSDDALVHYNEAFRKAELYIRKGSPIRKRDKKRLVAPSGLYTSSIEFQVR